MSPLYPHCFVPCPNRHPIPVPHSSPIEIDGSPRQLAKEIPRVNVVCPECGVVSAYSVLDMTGAMFVDKPNLFQEGECHLAAIEVECDGENCEAPKVVHAILGDEKGTWKPKAAPKDWHFSDSAHCEGGHPLRFEEPRTPFQWTNLHALPW
jgi:hypothetical protein